MLLGKKAKPTLESEWDVILDRPDKEFARTRAIDKLAEMFSLSQDESKDLIDNTPIILLDPLQFELAEKIKEYFFGAHVNCSLTNDTFTKRKCFRAIWPEPPNLSHLLNEPLKNQDGDFELPQTSAQETVLRSEEPLPNFVSQAGYVGTTEEQEKKLRELTLDLQKENELLKLQLAKTEGSIKERERERYSTEIGRLQTERLKSEEAISDSAWPPPMANTNAPNMKCSRQNASAGVKAGCAR